MIDVKEVIEGTYVPENMFQALEASVVVDELQAQVNKGKGQVFTYCLVVARNHYVKMKQVFEQGGWNDPETPWYIAAKAGFTEEAEQAIAQGNIRFEGQSFKTFENAVRTLKLAMERNAPLDERDDGTGSFALSSKGSLEKWNKEWKAAAEKAEQERAAAARKAAGITLAGVDDKKAETGGGESVLDLIQDEDLRSKVEQYVMLVAELEESDISEAFKMLNRGIGVVKKHMENSVKDLKNAAAA